MEPLRLVDCHVHLDEIPDVEAALEKALKAGVRGVIAVGMGLESNRRILEIAARWQEMVLPAVGYHPWEIRPGEISETLSFLEENLPRCVAVGEVGLDYKAKVKKELQREVFREILFLAKEHEKPLILHCRYSHRRVFEMLQEAGITKAVFHWYTGPLDLLVQIIDAGYYISVTPALSYSPPHRAAAEAAPLKRILLETDSPVRYGSLEARPHHLLLTLRELAKIKGSTEEDVARVCTENVLRLFGPRVDFVL